MKIIIIQDMRDEIKHEKRAVKLPYPLLSIR